MKKRSETLEYFLECLSRVGSVSSRAMFGGYGIYLHGLIFAIVVDDVLYFKVGDNNRADYEAMGCGPFQYDSKGKVMTMSYYELPESVLSDPQELALWVKKALDAHGEKKRSR